MSSALGWIAGLVNRLTRSFSAFRTKASIAWRVMRCTTIPILIQRGEDMVIVVKGTAVGRRSQAGGPGRAQAQGGAARRQGVRETRITELGTLTFSPYRPSDVAESPTDAHAEQVQAGAAGDDAVGCDAVERGSEQAKEQVEPLDRPETTAPGRRLVMVINQTASRR